MAVRFINERTSAGLDFVVDSLLAPPSPKCHRVTLEYSPLWSHMQLTLWNGGGHLLLSDPELQQLFDLIAKHFMMELNPPLSEFTGFWDEETWGPDPRKEETSG